jgi:putative membrane protein
MEIHDIPTLNAALNATATVLMTLGFIFIKAGKQQAHRAAMLTAGVVSAVFLVGYVTHKILIRGVHTPFMGEGTVLRSAYYAMLITHIILAMAIAYLVPRTFLFAIKGDFVTHKKWAKVTFPIWYYVSVTGVLVYLCNYVWWPTMPVTWISP